ncbi:MAG: hypothetical protein R2733_12350 [Acidimicrobiales bacterium]
MTSKPKQPKTSRVTAKKDRTTRRRSSDTTSTESDYPILRKRMRGRELPSTITDLEELLALLGDAEFQQLCLSLAPADVPQVGRPPKHHPAVHMVAAYARLLQHSERHGHRWLFDHWPRVHSEMFRTFGKAVIPKELDPPTRSATRRFFARSVQDNEDYFESMRSLAANAARSLGLGTGDGSLSNPVRTSTIFGDGAVYRARSSFTKEDKVIDPETGEIKSRRFDPDADTYVQGDETRIHGLKTAAFSIASDHPGERVLLDFDVDAGSNEAAAAMRIFERVADEFGDGIKAVTYDMAFAGKHIDQIYRRGIMPVIGVPLQEGGKLRNQSVGVHTLNLNAPHNGTLKEDVQFWAINGRPHIQVVAGSELLYEPLDLTRISRREIAFREYLVRAEFEVPNSAPFPKHQRGAKVLIRLNTTPEERKAASDSSFKNSAKRRSTAPKPHALRAHSEGDPNWASLTGIRQDSEALNAWNKDQQGPHRRSAVYGNARLRVWLSLSQLRSAIRSKLVRKRREAAEAAKR